MDYNAAKAYIEHRYKKGSVYGLEPITALCNRLNNPQSGQKIIHIAGTNGKGSVGTFIARVLMAQGYKAGRFVSPWVFTYLERLQINGENISKAAFAENLTRVAAAEAAIDFEPTGFELECACALDYFKTENCDFSIIECGLGGSKDATNVIDNNLLCVITKIGLDHTAILGNSPEAIAREKCGIIKPGTLVVSAQQEEKVENVIRAHCHKVGVACSFVNNSQITNKHLLGPYQTFDYGDCKAVKTSMLGTYQYENAALALEAIKALKGLGYNITKQSLYEGMEKACWPGRFQVIDTKPVFVLDGAHNPQGAKALAESLKANFAGKKFIFITGMFKDKDYNGIMEATAPLAEEILTVTPPSDRGLNNELLAKVALKYNSNARPLTLRQAFDYCINAKDYIIVAFGSLSFLGSLAEYISEYKE